MSEVRPEQIAFLQGVAWVSGHLIEAARRIRDDKRGTVEVEGKPPVEAILKSGNPTFANILTELADALMQEGIVESKKQYPDFDPLPKPMKAGESSGF